MGNTIAFLLLVGAALTLSYNFGYSAACRQFQDRIDALENEISGGSGK